MPLTNIELAELLARQSELESGILVRAFRRAARSALFWPESAATLVARHHSLLELRGIGPFIEKHLLRWIGNSEEITGNIPVLRRDFFSLADANAFLEKNPDWRKFFARRSANAHALERRLRDRRRNGNCRHRTALRIRRHY